MINFMGKKIFIGTTVVIFLLIGLILYSTFKNPLKPATELVAPTLSAETTMPIYLIQPKQSQVMFSLGEILNGSNKRVEGRTNQVAGQLQFDSADLSTAQIGEIVINARTFLTDNDFRNRAIHNRILFTTEFEQIKFRPKTLNGLPKSAKMGESADFEIVGDLTIKEVTKEVTFTATATISDTTTIRGHAESIIDYAAFNIIIPNVPSVTNVEDKVALTIDFVAKRSKQ